MDYLGAALVIAWLIGPIFCVIPMMLTKCVRDPRAATLWLGIGGYAMMSGGLMWLADMGRGDPLNDFYYHFLLLPCAVVFLILLMIGAWVFSKAGPAVGPFWLRALMFVSLLFLIPLGFSGIAEVIDGNRGVGSIIQYNAEFFWRLVDAVSFSSLSNFSIGGYDKIVVLTKSGSLAVMLFNVVILAFCIPWAGEILKAAGSRLRPKAV